MSEEDLWKKLRAPFPPDQLEKKPQVNCYNCTQATKAAKNARDKHCDRHVVQKCPICSAYITNGHIDLDYVGHANCTNRLLEVDPTFTWEPMSKDPRGLPAYDEAGNLWIYLTVLGVTKPGIGDGASLKEKIGDAIRNAAMRFGVALDLWAKVELKHSDGVEPAGPAVREYDEPPGVDTETGEVPMPEDNVRLIGKGQLITLKALESKLGKGGKDETPEDREARLQFYRWVSGEDVKSSKELTQQGAEDVITELRKRVSADAPA